ncbi:MAG: amidase family protein [bacterium]
MGLNEFGLFELIEMVKRGDVSPFDVANDFVAAADRWEPRIGAYIEFYAEDLLAQTRRLTEAGGYESTRFAGLPIAVKDNITVRGRHTTCGSRILAGWSSPYDATVIARLRRDGAVIAGKTNLDEFGMGSSTENSAFGPTRNPWDPTGGSIRQPAAFCGVVGMKPTYGRVSRYGLVAFASSLDQIGPIARNVRDCALVTASISGWDCADATSARVDVPDFEAAVERSPERGFMVGVPWDLLSAGMDPVVADNFKTVIGALESNGVGVVDVALLHSRYAVACYYTIANAEASSNLARFDGVKYGHRARTYDDLEAMITRTRDEGFGDEVKRRILLGTYVLSAGYYDAFYLKAQKVRSLVTADFERAFERCDAVLLPTSPTPAFRFGERTEEPLEMYLSDVFTIPANLAGLPAITLPSGLTPDGMPLGVQLIGRPFAETTVLAGAAALERMIDFKGRPGD